MNTKTEFNNCDNLNIDQKRVYVNDMIWLGFNNYQEIC